MLGVNYAGRSLLIIRDLEGAGLDALLRLPAEKVDVLLAPHHGAASANPSDLAAWCQPDVVIVSTGDRERARTVQAVYGADCRALSTANCGAVSVRIAPDGQLTARGFINIQ